MQVTSNFCWAWFCDFKILFSMKQHAKYAPCHNHLLTTNPKSLHWTKSNLVLKQSIISMTTLSTTEYFVRHSMRHDSWRNGMNSLATNNSSDSSLLWRLNVSKIYLALFWTLAAARQRACVMRGGLRYQSVSGVMSNSKLYDLCQIITIFFIKVRQIITIF